MTAVMASDTPDSLTSAIRENADWEDNHSALLRSVRLFLTQDTEAFDHSSSFR